ncbi:serine acetyltransferase [Massilia sp. W12]|uniref:serine acetyltransferase n=1 Tax=Massilia sp. W12 TaxID=3126507 RepID=UPI0030D07E0E
MKWNALKADTWRIYGRFSWGCVLRGFFSNRTYRVICTLRLCQAAAQGGAWKLALIPAKILHRWATHQAAMDLSWQTAIGPGIALTHGWALVVNPGAQIGRNVTLFHGVTLGRRDRIAADGSRQTEFPQIEDEVWIGAHAIIVGGVTIGRGSRIGAGAFVTEDVPPYSVVTGNPSSIVKQGCTPDVYNPAPAQWLGE